MKSQSKETKIKVISFSVMVPQDEDCKRCLEEKCYKNCKSPEGVFYCPSLQELVRMSSDLYLILDKWS
jgi:late competence protein required for DNA uptake (superfamily II DNA/RNA helicase)